MAQKIEVYTMKICPYCVQVKELLKARGVPFEEIMIGYHDEKAWQMLYEKSGGMQTVPQIYRDGAIIGGHIELAELDKKDKLESLKAE